MATTKSKKTVNLNNNSSFQRPENIRVVDMCIFVDKNFPTLVEHPNQELENIIVRYLYFIIDSLAKKYKYFTHYKDYDEFALFATSEVFNVMRSKWQRKGQIVRGKEVQPIKSCLNYIKNVLYPYKVQYQQANYAYITYGNMVEDVDGLQDTLRSQIRQQYEVPSADIFEEIFRGLPEKVHDHLYRNSPYRTDPTMLQRLYLSVMLTLIENITLRDKVVARLSKEEQKVEATKLLNALAKNEQNVILWHLPQHMENYVRFQVYKVKRIISNEFWMQRNPADLSDEVVDSIMKTAFTTYEQDQDEV